MKITCALGKDQIIALASVVYKDIQLSVSDNKPYDLRPLMARLYSNLSEKQSQENAIVYLMQVPSLAGQIVFREGAKPVEDFDISKILDLSQKFRNLDTGFAEVQKYFGIVASPSSLATKAGNEVNNPVVLEDSSIESLPADERKKVRVKNAISLTLEEFYEMDPALKTGTTVEIADLNKKTIYNVLDRLKKASPEDNVSNFEDLSLDGVSLRLRPFSLIEFPQSLLYPSTAKLLRTMNNIKNQTGEVKPPKEHFVVALVDEKGRIVKFNAQGIVDMENGLPVYQMLREVRIKNGKYEATDIYGREEQILGAEKELTQEVRDQGYKSLDVYLKDNGITREEAIQQIETERQSVLKKYFDFRERLVKDGTKGVTMSIVDVSPGVRSKLALTQKYNLNNLNTAFSPETAAQLFKSIKILDTAYKDISAGYGLMTINGTVYKVDRPDISEDLARKIAQVLTNDKISDDDKKSFAEQFLANQITSAARRQTIQINKKTKALEFLYTQYTEQEYNALKSKSAGAKNTLFAVDLKGGKASEDKIFEVLTQGKATIEKDDKGNFKFDEKGLPIVKKYYPAKMAFWSKALKPKLGEENTLVEKDEIYLDYENGKFVPRQYNTELLPTLNAEIAIDSKSSPLYNSYIMFSIPNEFNQTLEDIKEENSQDTRSDIRKFKDTLVENIKSTQEQEKTASSVFYRGDIVARTQSKKDQENNVYTYKIKVEGFPGEHNVFNSSVRDFTQYKLKEPISEKNLITGETEYSFNYGVRLILEDRVENGIYYNDVIGVYLYNDSGEEVVRLGSLQETSYNETPRTYTAIKTEEVNDVDETNEVEESQNVQQQPAPETDTESQKDEAFLNPKGIRQPGETNEGDRITDENGFGELDRRRYLGQEGVTQQQVDDGVAWWNRKENRLNQFMSVTTAMDLVNSNVFAKFIVSGHALLAMSEDFKLPKGHLGVIAINPMTGGNYVDVYHEAWHAFSQLFLTREQKIKLYTEIRNSDPKYKKMSFLEIEELLAENFREYARNPKPVKQQPVRNTLFRKILNFLRALFGKLNKSNLLDTDILALPNVQNYFNELYIGEINNYTPLIENVMFNQLNRGITDVTDKRTELLNDQDSADLVNTIDALLSKVVDEQAEDTGKKAGTVQILNNTKLKNIAFDYVRKYMEKQLSKWTKSLDLKQNISFNEINTLEELKSNAVAIIEAKSAKDNKYVFLKSQVESFKNLTASTKEGERVKGRLYKDAIEIVGDFYTHDTINADILIVDSVEDAMIQYESYLEGKTKKFKGITLQVEEGTESNLSVEDQMTLDNIRVYETALKNWDSVLKYHQSNSTFDIIRQKYVPLEEDPDAIAILTPENANKERTADKKTGEFSLLQLANKETIYILKSLFKVDRKKKKVDNKYQYELDRFGNPMLADFRTVWNSVIRATNSEKDPVVMYRKILQAASNFPELEQLIKFKLPNPELFADTLSTSEMDITTAFWQDFKRPNIPYIQALAINDETTGGQYEMVMTNASYDIIKTLRTFQSKFRSDTRDQFIEKVNNKSVLKLEAVVNSFKDDSGNFDDDKAFKFLTSIGFYLDDLAIIKKEINNVDNRRIYFVHRIYDTVKQIYDASKSKKLSKKGIEFIQEFKSNPVQKLRDGVPPGILGDENSSLFKNGISQRTVVDRILALQNRYGSDSSNFSIRNAEGQRVNTHTDDNTATMIADGINATRAISDMWSVVPDRTRSLKFLNSFNPNINPFTKRLQTFKTLYTPNNLRRMDKFIQIFMNSGTQITVNGDFVTGTVTADLDEQGYFLQGFNGLLLAGSTEFLRPGSKSSAFGWAIRGGINKESFKDNDEHLYADIDDFMITNNKENDVIKRILIPYLAGEVERINKIKENPKLLNYIGYNNKLSNDQAHAGSSFGAFDGIIKDTTQKEILSKVNNTATDLEDYLIEDSELQQKIIDEIKNYFAVRSNDIVEKLKKGNFVAPELMNKPVLSQLSNNDKKRVLAKAYMYNAWIHNFETQVIFLGDITQYRHPKEELHKRTSGLISNGPGFRVDVQAQLFIESQKWTQYTYAATLPEEYQNFKYNGTFNTAVIQDISRDSVYLKVIEEALTKDYKRRLVELPKAEADKIIKERVAKEIVKYTAKEIKEGDGQGYITIDAYRNLKKLQKKWSDEQEALYRKVVKGEEVPISDIIEIFPPYKLQHFGFLDNTELPVVAFHKFALFPLVPAAIKGSDLEVLHKEMLRNNIQYATFESGSKVGTVTSNGSVDAIYEEGSDQKKIKDKINFTKNTIHLEFLKEVTSVPSKFKGEVIFSTQLRKLILEGLFVKGTVVNEKNKPIVDNYKSVVDSYTQILKEELLQEIGYTKENGVYVGNPRKLLEVMKRNLKSKDMPQNLLDALRTNKDGSLRYDLSNFIDPQTLERTVLSIVENRFVRQKLNGEALVQVASSMTNGLWNQGTKFKEGTEEDILKYMGTNNLPFYYQTDGGVIDFNKLYNKVSKNELKEVLVNKEKVLEDQARYWTPTYQNNLRAEINYLKDVIAGNKPSVTQVSTPTLAMKVAIALQGDFLNLLNLKHLDGEKIGTRRRLNQMIKEDEWLNKDNNRKSITMTAVRIPVQGHNSMEFMEVWEFLDTSASNIIIPPTELVAKSGGDFDVDKLTTFMPNIDAEGNYISSNQSAAEILASIDSMKGPGRMQAIRRAKADIENQMIDSIKSILELPENYASLVRPNDTYMLKDLADELEEYVSDYDKFSTVNRDTPLMLKDKKVVSPTTTLEPLYNVSKFTQNMVGKAVLGIAANENAFSPLFNSIGAKMPLTYKDSYFDKNQNKWMDAEDGKDFKTRLLLLHNKFKNGQISLSDINSYDAINKIADVFSQGMNGWVDVEKDAWVFYIQGNLEISPVMLYLIKAGVPVRDAIMFVSNPLIREYAEKQRLLKGSYAELMGIAPTQPQFAQYEAAKRVMDPAIQAYLQREVNKLNVDPAKHKQLIIKFWQNQGRGWKMVTQEFAIEEDTDAVAQLKDYIFDEEYYFDPTSLVSIQLEGRTDKPTYELVYQRPEVTNAGVYDSAVRLSDAVLKGKETFDSKQLESLAKSKNLDDKYSDASIAVFLHFIEMEKYLKGMGNVKRTSKVDNMLFKTVQEVFLRDMNLKYLEEYSKVDKDTLLKLNEDSIISSMGDKEIIRQIIGPLFSLRNNEPVMAIIKLALTENADKLLARYKTINKETTSKFIEEYKNAINNFIFQNFLTNNLNDEGKIVLVPSTYKNGYTVKIKNNMDTDVEVDAENKLILVNTERIESDFKEKQFEVGKEGPKSYTKRGLEPFMINDTFSTLQSYYRYVMEREYLRAEGVETEDLNKIALINTFNPNVIMRNIKHSYTQQVMDIIQKYGSQLSKYTVLQQLTPSISSPLLNVLTLNDKQLVDGTLSNNYAQQIRDLGNERIRKISIPGDKEKEKAVNKEISRIFYLLPLMAVYQHGVGPTISGFNEILPQDHYLSVMNNASNLFKEHYFNAETLMAIFNRLTDSKESYTYNHKTYAMSLPTSKDTFVYEAPQFEDTVSNTDQFQYFGAMYSIVLEDGVGIDVVDYKGKPSAKAKLLAAYNTNKNVDPQNGKPFRSADQNVEEEPPVLPVEPEGADNNQNDTYSFTFANGITVDTPFQLNPEQQAALLALENFYRNPDKHNGKVTLVGYAGTGKTSIISIFDKWLQQVEFLPQLIYTSPTHRANAVTKLKNPNARVFTLHKLFGLGLQVVVDPTSKDYDAKYDTITVGKGTIKIKTNDTVIVDESSMVTDGLYDFLMQMKERFKLKIIFMGDPGQLGPVQDAGILSKVFSDPTSTIRLTQVMRTGDNPILKESTALRSGGELSYVSSETNGKGVEYTNDQARMNQIISSNMKKMMDSENYLYFRVLTATNNAAAEVNKAVRRVIFGEEAKEQLVYGDIIMGHANFGVDYKSGQPKIINSGDYKVVSIRKDESKTVYVPNEPALPEMFRGKELKFKGYRISLQNVLDTSETPVENLFVPYIGQNDENIRMLGETVAEMNKAAQEIHKTNKSKGAELYSTASSLESQLLLMEDGKGRTEKTKLKKYIDYGYAHTIHKSQGGTYTAVMVMDDTIAPLTKYIQKKRSEKGNVMTDEEAKTMQRQLKYVAVSRATDYVYIATDSGTNKSIYDGETYTEPGENGVTITGMSLSDIGEAPSNVKPAGRTGNSTTTINGATVVLGNQADFVGNSGAAKGSDAYFNYKSSGHPVSFMNWHNQGMLNRKKSGLEPDLLLPLMDNNPQALITDESEFAKVVEIGAKRLGKEARRPATINKLGRNWLQVKNSDAIFAVADSFYTRPDTNQLDMSNIAGGTGWAIAYAAEKIDGVERPIYVYVQSKNRWYKYNYNKGVFEEYNQTPVLTKRFAGIGTRDLKDNGKLAIDNLYKNTFSGQPSTQPTGPTVNTFTSSPINKGAEVEPGLEMFKNALTLDEQKVFFEFGKRVLEKNAYNPFPKYAMASAGQLEWSPELVIDKNGKEVERQGNYDQAIVSIVKNKTGSEGSEKRWTYHYYLSNMDGSPIEPIPSNVISILEKITGQSMADYDTVLINLYPIGRTLGWHQDVTEDYRNTDRDIISVSIGASSDFSYTNPGNKMLFGAPKGDTRTLQVNSGDVMLFGGKSRLIKHTVTNIAGTTNLGSINLQNSNVNDGFVGGKTLENWRMNFTFRVANPNNNKGKRGVTKTSSSGPQRFEGEMTYKYNDNGRPGLIADTTFDAILTGERTATTRYEKDGKLDYWKQVKVGDIITWKAADGRKVDVVVTKALYKLKGSGMTPKEWAELEGWSSMYFLDKVLPKIDGAYQLQYKLINPKQYGDISNNDIFDDSDESDLENNCPVPF